MTIGNAYPSGGAGAGAAAVPQHKYMFRDHDTTLGGSSSTSAMKIQWFTCDVNMTVSKVLAGIEAKANEVYQVFVVEEDGVTAKEVAALTATSLALTNSAVTDTKMSVWEFEFASDFELVAGKGYGLCFTVTSGTTGLAARISFDTDGFVPSPDITRGDVSHLQKNIAPVATDDLTGTTLTTFTVVCGFRYTRT